MYGKSNMETYITICKIDSQREFAVWLRKLKQGSVSTQRGGMGKEMGGKFKMEQICASDQIRSVTQSCLTLCDPMNRSTPGLPVHHQLPEFTQTHVRGVSDAIQPSHPLSSPSPPAPNPSQHQSLLQ